MFNLAYVFTMRTHNTSWSFEKHTAHNGLRCIIIMVVAEGHSKLRELMSFHWFHNVYSPNQQWASFSPIAPFHTNVNHILKAWPISILFVLSVLFFSNHSDKQINAIAPINKLPAPVNQHQHQTSPSPPIFHSQCVCGVWLKTKTNTQLHNSQTHSQNTCSYSMY